MQIPWTSLTFPGEPRTEIKASLEDVLAGIFDFLSPKYHQTQCMLTLPVHWNHPGSSINTQMSSSHPGPFWFNCSGVQPGHLDCWRNTSGDVNVPQMWGAIELTSEPSAWLDFLRWQESSWDSYRHSLIRTVLGFLFLWWQALRDSRSTDVSTPSRCVKTRSSEEQTGKCGMPHRRTGSVMKHQKGNHCQPEKVLDRRGAIKLHFKGYERRMVPRWELGGRALLRQ